MHTQITINFDITITGRGGHGSRPDRSHNPIDAFLTLHSALTQFRPLDTTIPCFCEITEVYGGKSGNIIPDKLQLKGKFHCGNPADAEHFRTKLPVIAQAASQRWLCSASVQL